MNDQMKASIVVPTHDRESLLRELLLALARQTYGTDRFEVVVVVDGSADGTVALLKSVEVPYRLRFSVQPPSGVARARNVGSELAESAVIMFLDDDIVPVPTLLADHLRYHDEDPFAVVIGRVSPSPRRKRPGWSRWEEQLLDRHFRALARRQRSVEGRHLYSGNFSVRRRFLLQVGGFDETMGRAEDIDLGYRLEQIGLHFYFEPRADGEHRGYRSYGSWAKVPYQYGRLDVFMGREKGYAEALDEVYRRFHERNLIGQLSVKLCLGRPRTSRLLLGSLRLTAAGGDRLGLSRLTRYLYSGIYNFRYWQGVSDASGGRDAFWHEVERRFAAVDDRYGYAGTSSKSR